MLLGEICVGLPNADFAFSIPVFFSHKFNVAQSKATWIERD